MRCIPSHSVAIIEETKDVVLEEIAGAWVAKSKERCILRLIQGNEELGLKDENTRLDFAHRSGFVELSNGVALFVTLPTLDGIKHSRSYPNEWLEDGSVMSWFVKENDWRGGTTRLGQKMTFTESNSVILFVRRGKGEFFCCGRCRVTSLEGSAEKGSQSDQWSITKVFLQLLDYGKLQALPDFQVLVNPARYQGSSEPE